jgi:aryl carrier-like protein
MLNRNEKDQNSTEIFLVQCLSNLLQVEEIGLQDNLFNLGLDSVLVAMLINRIRDEFNVELSILTVFQTPTIDALALAVQDLQGVREDRGPEDEPTIKK